MPFATFAIFVFSRGQFSFRDKRVNLTCGRLKTSHQPLKIREWRVVLTPLSMNFGEWFV